ncbi:secreted protein [Mycobacterium pseudoshottsii JCM 15466]|nr:secreted protein [Mycobacterium pseudoshottsii JCM 15466]
MGHQICADRMSGKTPDAIAQDIHTTLGEKGITFADVTSMVSAAESTYCSD